MTTQSSDPLEKIIRDAGEGWMIDWYAPREQALPKFRQILAQIDARAKERFGAESATFDENVLIQEYEENPRRVHAFLQALGSTDSVDMLVMVWRVICGAEIAGVLMTYVMQNEFSLQVRLTAEPGQPQEVYQSNDIDDAKLLRHFGIMKMNDQPIFDGFYALSVK